MAKKYHLEYYDVENVLHELELYDDAFSGTSTEISGNVVYNYGSVNDPLESIRGSGLTVTLQADTTLTFDDLFTEEERQIQVIYKRNSETKFVGWLNPEGWYESFVNDRWDVTFDVVDGLSYLKDLSYVDSSGLFYTGKQSQLEVIVNCLARTGLQLNINTDIRIVYSGLSTSVDVLDNVFVNTQRFIKDDGDTIMDCDKVLRSILEPYGACITMHNGEWVIFKPNQIYSSYTYVGYYYDYTGTPKTSPTHTINTSFDLGSQVDSYYPHHSGENQQISNVKSLGALRINYKYGFVKSFYENNMFYSSDGSTLSDWTIDSGNSSYLTLTSGGYGAELDIVDSDLIILSYSTATLDAGITINFYSKFKPTGSVTLCNMMFKVSISSYYLQANGEWTTTDTFIVSDDLEVDSTIYSIDFASQPIPVSGSLLIYVYLPKVPSTPPTPSGSIELIELTISNEDQSGGIKQGENHTFQRTTNPSSNVDEVKEVTTGDSVIDAYQGTIYKNNETDPTETWNRIGVSESIPILQLMGEEHLRLKQSTQKVFSGSVYGYFSYFSRITINNITGIFIPLEYSYDTKQNTISFKAIQIYGDELTDIDYELTYDYGNVVKPTIRG